jgi:ribosome biogenesis GTPase
MVQMDDRKRKKKQRRQRKADWESEQDTTYSRDLKRHLRTTTAVSDAAPMPDIPEDFEPNGLVISRSRKWAFVQWDGREDLCKLTDDLAKRGASVAPGDRVLIEEIEGSPWVRAVAPRRTKLSRPAMQHAESDEQVFAANVDVLVVVASAAKPAFKPGLVDRYLIAAEVGGVEAVLCFNKVDLVDAEPPELQAYRDLGVHVIKTSCETGEGLNELRAALRGKMSIFAGHSGVGKSSLLNALQPDLDLETREISEATKKGKHTTTTARLYQLDDGIRVIDTPGIRALGLWEVSPEEVAYYFPEIAEHGAGCKFRDCTHTHEPKCAVREAVETGAISRHRFESFQRIRESLGERGQSR